MILLTKNSINEVILTLNECTTLESPYYLFRLINDQNCTVSTFISVDVSVCKERFNQFYIQESNGTEDLYNSVINLNLEGFYSYEVYEQDNNTNLDYEAATGLVECGVLRLVDNINRRDNAYCEYEPSKDIMVYDPLAEEVLEGIGAMVIGLDFCVF